MLQITDWHNRYEVGSRGGKPKDGEPLRVGPLEFIRLNAHGRSQGPGYRRLLDIAGERTMQVFGIFCKFLEIAGNECKDKRGTLYNESGKPATPDDLAFILSVPLDQVKHAIVVLCDKKVKWLINTTQLNSTQLNITQGSRNPRKTRESPETKRKPFIPPTLEDVKKYVADNPELSNVDPVTFWKGFNDGDWIDTQGKPVRNWKLKIRTWSNYGHTSKSQRTDTSQAGSRQSRPHGEPPAEYIR